MASSSPLMGIVSPRSAPGVGGPSTTNDNTHRSSEGSGCVTPSSYSSLSKQHRQQQQQHPSSPTVAIKSITKRAAPLLVLTLIAVLGLVAFLVIDGTASSSRGGGEEDDQQQYEKERKEEDLKLKESKDKENNKLSGITTMTDKAAIRDERSVGTSSVALAANTGGRRELTETTTTTTRASITSTTTPIADVTTSSQHHYTFPTSSNHQQSSQQQKQLSPTSGRGEQQQEGENEERDPTSSSASMGTLLRPLFGNSSEYFGNLNILVMISRLEQSKQKLLQESSSPPSAVGGDSAAQLQQQKIKEIDEKISKLNLTINRDALPYEKVTPIWPSWRRHGKSNERRRRPLPPSIDDITMDRFTKISEGLDYAWDEEAINASYGLANVNANVGYNYGAGHFENTFWKYKLRKHFKPSDPERHFSKSIQIRFGVLTIARFVNTRLLPMLNTSLLHATSVDVFIRKTNVSYAVADYIRASVRQFHPHWRGIRVVELYGPDPRLYTRNHYEQLIYRNVWQNLEIMRFWRAEAEAYELISSPSSSQRRGGEGGAPFQSQWYSIIDDDGYVFVDSAKAMLWDIEAYEKRQLKVQMRNETLEAYYRKYPQRRASQSSAAGSDDEENIPPPPKFDINAIRDDDLELPPLAAGITFWLQLYRFANGGPGYYFNRAALLNFNESMFQHCTHNVRFEHGDMVGTVCLQLCGAQLIKTPHVYNNDLDGAIIYGLNRYSPFPVAFHKIHGGLKHMHALRRIEDWRLRRGEVVHWDDISFNFNKTETMRMEMFTFWNESKYGKFTYTPAPPTPIEQRELTANPTAEASNLRH